MNLMASVPDPAGRLVQLTEERWQHIVLRHPELEPYLADVLSTVQTPDHSGPDPIKGRERYWRRQVGPFPWLRVVVDFSVEPAAIVTAFPNRKKPPEWNP